jgi:coenzyme F420-reducing hydrogenase delta subunit
MVPRADERPFPTRALVDPSKCLGCGICAGSCDSAGIGLDWFDALAERQKVDRFVSEAGERGAGEALAFVCAGSAGAALKIDPASGHAAELPGWRILRVPCAGWVHSLLVERGIRRGASAVLVVACGPGSCTYREGGTWAKLRLSGRREPSLRTDKVAPEQVRFVQLHVTEGEALGRAARELRDKAVSIPAVSRVRRALVTAVLPLAFLGAVVGGSRVGYTAPGLGGPELVVSFKDATGNANACRDLTEAERGRLPVHMRPKQVCERRRKQVSLRVLVDSEQRLNRVYLPRGLWGDGNSVALERFPMVEGQHRVRVELVQSGPDSARAPAASLVFEQSLGFAPGHQTVVVYEKMKGFVADAPH